MKQGKFLSESRTYVAVLFLVVPLVVLTGMRTRPEQSEHDEPEDASLRSEWFRLQRAYPYQHIPAGARLRALQQLSQKMEMEAQTTGVGGAMAGTSWQLLGPQPTNTGYAYPTTSGRVTALAVDPTSSSTIYAGGAEGGIQMRQ